MILSRRRELSEKTKELEKKKVEEVKKDKKKKHGDK